MTNEQRYKTAINNAIKEVGEDYNIKYSMYFHSDPLHKGAVANAYGTINVRSGYATNLEYSFEIEDSGFKFFTVGKILGIGNDNIPSLNKIKELNKHISMNLGSILVERELEIDLIREEKFKGKRRLA